MRKVMLLAAMLAMVLAVAAPAFAQATAVQYDGDDETATFCNQVQSVIGVQGQYGDANAAATDDSEAIAEAANELNVSQDQVLNCFVGNEDVEDVNLGGGTDGGIGVVEADDDGDGTIDEEFDVVPVDGVDNDEDGVVDEADGTEVEAAAAASATATAAASATATAAAEEGAAVLPETGGASLLALGAGALLVAGGLLARRIVR